MAQFNPAIQPTNDPNYENRSRPIDVPDSLRPRGVEENRIMPEGQKIGDRSAEYLGQAAAFGMQADGASKKAYGDLFAGIVGIADFAGKAGVQMVKKDIEDRVYDVANKERLAYTESLEQIKAGKGVKSLLDARAEADGGSDELPDEVDGLPDRLGSLTGARDAGKISNSYYQARLLAEAKDLRARYPGFRQEIDDQFARVTGVNPANAYINSLVGDINRAAAAANKGQSKIESYILQRQGYPNAVKMYHDFKAGLIKDTDVLTWAAPYERQEQELKMRAAKINDAKATRGEVEYQASRGADAAFGMVVGRSVDQMLGRMQINSAEDASKLDLQVKAGAIPASRFQELGQEIADHRAQLKIQMKKDADVNGITKILGADEVNKRIDASLQQLEVLNDRVYHKDFGGIYRTAKAIKSQTEDDTMQLLQNTKVGPAMRQMMVLREIGGEQWFQKFNLDLIKSGLPAHYSAYAERWMSEIASQTNMRTTGMPVTLNDMLDEFKAKGMNDNKVNSAIINMIGKISDKDTPDEVKSNLALAAFHPNNNSFISKLNVDGVDSSGRKIQGMNATFQKFTTPEMTAAMKKLGETKPEIWNNYVNWAKTTLGTELISREVQDLKTIPDNANVKVGWDDKNSRFFAIDTRPDSLKEVQRGYHVSAASNQYFKRVEASLNRINSNLGNYKNIAEASGGDVNAFLLKSIADIGGRDALTKVEGIPFQMLQQIGLMKLRSGVGSK